MKISLNWIKEYVELPSDWDLSRLAYDLTMSTVEVEEVVELAKKYNNIVVGEVKEVLSHPNADKLRIAKTDIGGGVVKDIVCGGSNLYNGMRVVVALPGSFVRWHGEGELVEIKQTKLRGVDSFGMICSATEIGMSELIPSKEEAEIIDLSSIEAVAGEPIVSALDIDDVILDIDNKSLTNRPDLWGHYGMAREFAAIYNLPLKEIKPSSMPNVPELKIDIENSNLCKRYIGVKIENLKVKQSPMSLQSRIWSVGVRPINAIVDITNYIMLATGQPTHAFDFDKIEGNISVRNAKDKEKLLLLSDEEVELSSNDLVIADQKGAIGLAGVIGGKKDSVLDETNKIVLEIANFDAITIRRTSLRYDVRTESSIRNEKALDAERGDVALSVAMKAFEEIYPEHNIVAFSDNWKEKNETKTIKLSLNWLKNRLGKDLSNKTIEEKLNLLGFKTNILNNELNVEVPSWRATGDVSIADDIIEEVARIYGFENFETLPITTTFSGTINQLNVDIDRKLREYFAFRHEMNEVFSYPWVNEDYLTAFGSNKEDLLALSSPPSPKEKYLRSSLLPNLVKAVAGNLRYFNEFRVFESAQVFYDTGYKSDYDKQEKLPKYNRSIAGAVVGEQNNSENLFRQVKGILSGIPARLHTEDIGFSKDEKPFWSDNVAWLNIKHNNKVIGSMGLLSKKVALASGIKKSAVAVFEFNIDELQLHSSRSNKFVAVSEYPTTDRDISMLVNTAVKWDDIKKIITSSGKSKGILQDVLFVEEYRGKQVESGKKSVTIKLVIGSRNKTLTSNEIEECVNSVSKLLKTKLLAEIR